MLIVRRRRASTDRHAEDELPGSVHKRICQARVSQRRVTCRVPLVGRLAFATLLLSGVSRAAAAQTLFAERIFDRDLAVWFGTLSVVGVPVASQDFLRLSDRINDGLESGIVAECGFGRDLINGGPCPFVGDRSVDARVRNGLGPWISHVPTNIEWVVASPFPPDNFPAHQNLLDAFAATALALQAYWGPGNLVTQPIAANTRDYLLDYFSSNETGPATVGDTDAPFIVGAPGQHVDVTNTFIARVQYFQQNAVWTLSNQNPNPTVAPEPGTLLLLAAGLLTVLIVRRRRASAGVHRSQDA